MVGFEGGACLVFGFGLVFCGGGVLLPGELFLCGLI